MTDQKQYTERDAMGLEAAQQPNTVSELQKMLADQDDAVAMMQTVLHQTANALKGDPGELRLHSWHDLPKVAADLTKLHDGLLQFARTCISAASDGCAPDGYEIQELAVDFCLIEEHHVNEPCGDTCECSQLTGFPTICYRYAAPLLTNLQEG